METHLGLAAQSRLVVVFGSPLSLGKSAARKTSMFLETVSRCRHWPQFDNRSPTRSIFEPSRAIFVSLRNNVIFRFFFFGGISRQRGRHLVAVTK